MVMMMVVQLESGDSSSHIIFILIKNIQGHLSPCMCVLCFSMRVPTVNHYSVSAVSGTAGASSSSQWVQDVGQLTFKLKASSCQELTCFLQYIIYITLLQYYLYKITLFDLWKNLWKTTNILPNFLCSTRNILINLKLYIF